MGRPSRTKRTSTAICCGLLLAVAVPLSTLAAAQPSLDRGRAGHSNGASAGPVSPGARVGDSNIVLFEGGILVLAPAPGVPLSSWNPRHDATMVRERAGAPSGAHAPLAASGSVSPAGVGYPTEPARISDVAYRVITPAGGQSGGDRGVVHHPRLLCRTAELRRLVLWIQRGDLARRAPSRSLEYHFAERVERQRNSL